jgi:hypothetical protein
MGTMRTLHITQRISQKDETDENKKKPKTDLIKNRPSVGFWFIENRLVSVSVSRRALLTPL